MFGEQCNRSKGGRPDRSHADHDGTLQPALHARIIVNTADTTATWDAASLREMKRQLEITGTFYRRLLERKEAFHLEPFDSRIWQRTRAGAYRRCQPGIQQVVVAPDGVLYGCIEYYHRRLEPLGTAPHWVDPARARSLARSRRGRPDECTTCGIRDRCNNACACVNLRGTGLPNRPPASLCLTEQETVRTVDAVAGHIFKRKVPEFLLRQYSCSYHVLSAIEKLLATTEVDHEPVETR
jgi:radical SAM protein with 4Fe4S-binding SPASM domain